MVAIRRSDHGAGDRLRSLLAGARGRGLRLPAAPVRHLLVAALTVSAVLAEQSINLSRKRFAPRWSRFGVDVANQFSAARGLADVDPLLALVDQALPRQPV